YKYIAGKHSGFDNIKIPIAFILQYDGVFRENRVGKSFAVMHGCLADVYQRRQHQGFIPLGMYLDASFCCPKLCPVKKAQTYADRATVPYQEGLAFDFFNDLLLVVLFKHGSIVGKQLAIKSLKYTPGTFLVAIAHGAFGWALFQSEVFDKRFAYANAYGNIL